MAHEVVTNRTMISSHQASELTDSIVMNGGTPAWHGLGVTIEEDISATEAAQKYGMAWPVDSYELMAVNPEYLMIQRKLKRSLNEGDIEGSRELFSELERMRLQVETHMANVRVDNIDGQDIKSILGVVGKDYKIAQNLELAEFTDALAQTGEVKIESAGTIRGGKRIWFLVRGESMNIGGADEVFPYIMVSNGHDGGSSIRVTPTTIRTQCSNTFHMVVPRGENWGSKKAENAAIVMRHSGNLKDKLSAAREAIRQYDVIRRRNLELFNMMNDKEIDRDLAKKLFAKSYVNEGFAVATEIELMSENMGIRKRAEKRMARMQDACTAFLNRYDRERAETGNGETAWMVFNGLSGYYQHDRGMGGKDDAERLSKKMDQNLFGLGADRAHRAMELVLAV